MNRINKCFGIFALFSLVLSFSSCNFFDSADEVPMYLLLDSVSLSVKVNQGANTHAITDVWVFSDEQQIGVFELPVEVPILDLDDDGLSNITIFAGVRANGIKSDAIIYPFYERLEFQIDFEEQKKTALDLEFEYVDDAVFQIVEGFENGNVFNFDVDQSDETTIVIDQTDAASGNASARVDMAVDAPNFEVSTTNLIDINTIDNGSRVFLEIDYKNTIELQVGLITIEGNLEFKEYQVLLFQKDDWNKVYIDFSNQLASSNISFYKPLLGIVNPDEIEHSVNFDNIKLIHF